MIDSAMDAHLTIFSWGYYGWGNATRQLLEAVDHAESQRGFRPPLFVDIRYRRTVRAPGFSGDAFRKNFGSERYKWMQRLGNANIATREPGVCISDPAACTELLEVGLDCLKKRRRVLFFCSCAGEKLLQCHRHDVASLVLAAARDACCPVEIVEWPGGSPLEKCDATTDLTISAIRKGKKSVLLGGSAVTRGLATLPWGSIVALKGQAHSLPIVCGPAKYHPKREWYLEILHHGDIDVDPSSLLPWAKRFRNEQGLNSRYS